MGLASTLILARLLTPADFGLVAMATIVVGLVDLVLDLGVVNALIQNKTADRVDFDTAWTLRICQALLVAAILAGGAPLAASYYQDERVVDILRVLAISVVISGFDNIGIAKFQKEMEFGREMRFFLAKRSIATVVSIVVAVILRSYWALIIGSLVSRLIGLGLSYWMHPFRPRLSLARVRQIWAFSQWNIVSSVASYAGARLDQFIIGRRADASVLGAYALGNEIASMPSTELLAPLGRVMLPAFVLARDDAAELSRIVLLSLAVQALIGVPAGVGLALVASEAIPVLLGERWTVAVPFVQMLGFAGIVSSMMSSSVYLLLALGKMRTLAIFNLVILFVYAFTLVVAWPSAGADEIVVVRLATSVGALALMLAISAAVMPDFRLRTVAAHTWRPIAAVIVMAIAVNAVRDVLDGSAAWIMLLTEVITGVVVYVVALSVLWKSAGSPAGGETYIFAKFRLQRAIEWIRPKPGQSPQ